MRLRAVLVTLAKSGKDYSQYADLLEQAGLKTSEDLLFTSSTSAQYATLPHGSMSYVEFEKLKEEVTKFVAAPGVRGDEAYMRAKEQEEARYKGYCGLQELDDLLDGFGQYGVIEISGGKETCKTLLAFQVILRYLTSQPQGTALWIDTSNSFNPNRALEICHLIDPESEGDALHRLQVAKCFDVAEALDTLDLVRQSIELKTEGADTTVPRFVVIDAITPLLSKEISSVSSQGHAIMVSFLRQLKDLAKSGPLTVLVINNAVLARPYINPGPDEPTEGGQPDPAVQKQATDNKETRNELSAFINSTLKPALGPTFTFLTDATLWLSTGKDIFPDDPAVLKATREKVYVAEVLRSRSSMSGTWCAFKSDGLALLPA